jgi:signal peptidase II
MVGAIALNGIGFNLARAVGPALGGFAIAAAGPEAAFALNAVAFLVLILALVFYHEREGVRHVSPLTIGVGLLIGGAIGNFIDRMAFGYVLDFVDVGVGSLRFWTFNIADAGISLGIVILFIDTVWRSRSTVRA